MVIYGNDSFVFTGDGETVSESHMLSKGLDLSATGLKVGHHGSKPYRTKFLKGKP